MTFAKKSLSQIYIIEKYSLCTCLKFDAWIAARKKKKTYI